jgi:hypothetical protein
MDAVGSIVGWVQDLFVLFAMFTGIFFYAIIRGQRALLSVVLALYIALLLAEKFPYYPSLEAKLSFLTPETSKMTVFAACAALSSLLFERLLSRLLNEFALEGVQKKVILSSLATILVMGYAYHFFPLQHFINPGDQLNAIFEPHDRFFWWLVIPLVGIAFTF